MGRDNEGSRLALSLYASSAFGHVGGSGGMDSVGSTHDNVDSLDNEGGEGEDCAGVAVDGIGSEGGEGTSSFGLVGVAVNGGQSVRCTQAAARATGALIRANVRKDAVRGALGLRVGSRIEFTEALICHITSDNAEIMQRFSEAVAAGTEEYEAFHVSTDHGMARAAPRRTRAPGATFR